jgi:hypothetical protein
VASTLANKKFLAQLDPFRHVTLLEAMPLLVRAIFSPLHEMVQSKMPPFQGQDRTTGVGFAGAQQLGGAKAALELRDLPIRERSPQELTASPLNPGI